LKGFDNLASKGSISYGKIWSSGGLLIKEYLYKQDQKEGNVIWIKMRTGEENFFIFLL